MQFVHSMICIAFAVVSLVQHSAAVPLRKRSLRLLPSTDPFAREVERARGETPSSGFSPNCAAGERVRAFYVPTGEFRDAVIRSVNKDGTVTVIWRDGRDSNRQVPGDKILRWGKTAGMAGLITCIASAPTSSQTESEHDIEVAVQQLRAPTFTTTSATTTAIASTSTISTATATTITTTTTATATTITTTTTTSATTITTTTTSTQAPVRVVYFLFMVDDHLPHAALWSMFFAGAPRESWRALVHCQDAERCRENGVHEMPGFEMVATVPTWYCHDLVTAMAELLRSALAIRAEVPHPSSREKFVFLSDSTLPIKPFGVVHDALMSDEDSDFCVFPKDQWASATLDDREMLLVKHHQWLVLTRQHAELFVQKWVPVDAGGDWRVWMRSGPWPGEAVHVSPHDFHHPPSANWCTDEWAFIATTFGAVAVSPDVEEYGARLPGFGGGPLFIDGARAHVTQGRCRTFTFWTSDDGPAFAALAEHVYEDHGSVISCYPQCHSRPATFTRMSATGLRAMRDSEFLFARKFDAAIELPHFEAVVLSH